MTDIKIGLTIREDLQRAPFQFGLALAGDRSTNPLDVHIEAYGFRPDRDGAANIVGLLRDLATALEHELGIAGNPAQGHNTLDDQCSEHVMGEAVGAAARCPVCRPLARPAFNPQPIKR